MGFKVPSGVASAVFELEARERRFRAVFESALDAIVIFDDAGRVLEANQAAATLFGLAADSLTGRRLEEFCRGLTGDRTLADLRSAGRLRREFEVVRSDGERRTIESGITADFVPGQHVGVLHDVTEERQHARERLRLAERFERLFRTDVVGMALINRQAGRVDDCNDKLAAFFGRRRDDIVGRHVTEFEEFFVSRERYRRLLIAWASGAPLRGLPLQSLWPDGTTRQGLATFETLPGVDGQGPVDVAVVMDVTDQHRMELERRQAQRLEAIGRLAGGIAHEFNNLLAVISGFATLLETTVAASPDAREAVAEIRRATNRAVKLVHGLLAFSRQEPFQPRPLNVHELLQRSAGGLQELLGPQVALNLQLQAPNPWVETDALQFEHALQQLAANARDAMPDGGALTIRTCDAGIELLLEVEDTGTGMDPVTLERAFEPFFTTKPIGAATGLGLAMVYGTITRSGGRVAARSEPLKGTTMQVFLPSVQAPSGQPTPDRPREPRPIVGTETILLVEPDTSVALLIESFLTRLGYRVIYAPNTKEALATIDDLSDRLDLVVAETALADGGPAIFLDRLRAARPRLPAIVLGTTAPAAGSLPAGTGALIKPFAMSDLALLARTLLEGAD